MSARAQEVLAAGRLIALRAAPYFRSMLHSFECREAPGLGTVACTVRGILLYDPEWVAVRTPAEMAGLWAHESMHRLLGHHHRCGTRDPRTFNQAGDLAINPAVEEMGLTLPVGDARGLYPADCGFDRGLTADAYYDLLSKGGGKGGKGAGDGEQPKAGGGWCGSVAGRPVPGEPPPTEGRGDAAQARLVRETADAIRDHARARGTLPAGLARFAEEALAPARIPWRTVLARRVRAAAAWSAGAVDHRYDGPGRRQAGIGYGVGLPVLPRLRAPVPRVAVVVDTSGSMSTDDLAAALTETRGVLAAVGAAVDFVACDAAVHGGVRAVRSVKEAAASLRGGGGTDMRPALDALAARRPRPNVIIVATDGWIGDAGPAPAWARVVWLLVGKSALQTPPAPWGDVVRVEEVSP